MFTLVHSLCFVWTLYIVLGCLKTHLAIGSRGCCHHSEGTEEEQNAAACKAARINYCCSMLTSLEWSCGIVGAVLTLVYLFKG